MTSMNARRMAGVVTALAMAVLLGPFLVPSAEANHTAAPRAAAGLEINALILAENGAPMSGGTARTSTMRVLDDVSRVSEIDSREVPADGRLQLSIPASELPQAAQVQMELEVVPAGGSGLPLLFDFTVNIGADGATSSTIPDGAVLQAAHGLLSPTEITQVLGRGGKTTAAGFDEGLRAGSVDEAEIGQDTEETVPADDETVGMAEMGGKTSCASDEITAWFPKGKYRYPYVPTKYIRTTSRAKFTWDIGRTNETSMELSYNYDGDHFAGGLVESRSNTSSINYTVTTPSLSTKIFKIKWRFRLERKACRKTVPGTSPWVQIAAYRWYPVDPLVGTKTPDTTDQFSCGGSGPAYVDNIATKTTVASSSDVNLRGFFSVAGVTLDANQVDSSSQVFTVQPRGSADAKVCGYDDTPRYAKLVKELIYN